ncbi:MAG: hypothetical protein EBX44_11600 [Betaproteobacteria bacterium]|nr:hypothetical protein [Betaproteobacteria bacterium]
MNIKSGVYASASMAGSEWARADSKPQLDPSKEASIAQSTVRLVQESLAKTAVGIGPTPSPSAQLAVDPVRVSKLAGAEKAKDPEKLDKNKLDEIKAKIESGDFEFDYGAIAEQLVQAALHQKTRR